METTSLSPGRLPQHPSAKVSFQQSTYRSCGKVSFGDVGMDGCRDGCMGSTGRLATVKNVATNSPVPAQTPKRTVHWWWVREHVHS